MANPQDALNHMASRANDVKMRGASKGKCRYIDHGLVTVLIQTAWLIYTAFNLVRSSRR